MDLAREVGVLAREAWTKVTAVKRKRRQILCDI